MQLKCLASIARFYWKSAEVTLVQEKPKFASVMASGDDLEVEKAGKLNIRLLKAVLGYCQTRRKLHFDAP